METAKIWEMNKKNCVSTFHDVFKAVETAYSKATVDAYHVPVYLA